MVRGWSTSPYKERLRGTGLIQPEEEKAKGGLIAVSSSPMERYREDEDFSQKCTRVG